MGQRATKDQPLDVVLVHGRTEDGLGLRALRARGEGLSRAELRPLEEGKPLAACEIVRLSQREESPLLFDVDVQHEVRGAGGPAQVASPAYRENWERIFGGRSRAGGEEPN